MKHIYTLTLFFIFNIANSQTLLEWETGSVFAFDNLSTNFDTAKTTEGYSIESIKVYPNPIKNFIRISGLTQTKNYELFNVLGAKVLKGTISNNQKISVNNLTNGLYFLKFDSGNTLKIIKE